MPLVLTDQRLDLRQFPNLMPQRRGITAPQTPAALATNRRRERYHLLALIAGDQGPLVLGMPRLTARPLFRLELGRSGFGVGMLGTGRQRRILRGLVHSAPPLIELPFQLRDPCLIVVNDRLHQRPEVGRQGGELFRRDRRLWRGHACDVAKIPILRQINFPLFSLRAVNDCTRLQRL